MNSVSCLDLWSFHQHFIERLYMFCYTYMLSIWSDCKWYLFLISVSMCSLLMGTSLAVQWLRLCASTAGATGLILGRGTKIPHATRCGQKKKRKRNMNDFCVLILFPVILLNILFTSRNLGYIIWNLLCRKLYHLQIRPVLFLSNM